MGLVAVGFLALINLGIELIWPDDTPTGLFSGKWWFIPLIGAFGLVVGLLRRALHVEPVIPGLFEEIKELRPAGEVTGEGKCRLFGIIRGCQHLQYGVISSVPLYL